MPDIISETTAAAIPATSGDRPILDQNTSPGANKRERRRGIDPRTDMTKYTIEKTTIYAMHAAKKAKIWNRTLLILLDFFSK